MMHVESSPGREAEIVEYPDARARRWARVLFWVGIVDLAYLIWFYAGVQEAPGIARLTSGSEAVRAAVMLAVGLLSRLYHATGVLLVVGWWELTDARRMPASPELIRRAGRARWWTIVFGVMFYANSMASSAFTYEEGDGPGTAWASTIAVGVMYFVETIAALGVSVAAGMFYRDVFARLGQRQWAALSTITVRLSAVIFPLLIVSGLAQYLIRLVLFPGEEGPPGSYVQMLLTLLGVGCVAITALFVALAHGLATSQGVDAERVRAEA